MILMVEQVESIEFAMSLPKVTEHVNSSLSTFRKTKIQLTDDEEKQL